MVRIRMTDAEYVDIRERYVEEVAESLLENGVSEMEALGQADVIGQSIAEDIYKYYMARKED